MSTEWTRPLLDLPMYIPHISTSVIWQIILQLLTLTSKFRFVIHLFLVRYASNVHLCVFISIQVILTVHYYW